MSIQDIASIKPNKKFHRRVYSCHDFTKHPLSVLNGRSNSEPPESKFPITKLNSPSLQSAQDPHYRQATPEITPKSFKEIDQNQSENNFSDDYLKFIGSFQNEPKTEDFLINEAKSPDYNRENSLLENNENLGSIIFYSQNCKTICIDSLDNLNDEKRKAGFQSVG